MQTLIVGDIHGCFDELQDLLAAAGLSDGDIILATGDIVDRGPGTQEVLQFFAAHPNARSLTGNHERKHIRSFAHEINPSQSQLIAREQIGDSYPDWVAFMKTFPIYIQLPEAILVHAYFEPGIPLPDQQVPVLCGQMSGEFYLKKKYARPWYELYDGDKPIVVGHHDILFNGQVFIYRDRVFDLDTSCVHGRRLSGLLLPAFKIVSVPSRGDHWLRISREYRLKKAETGQQIASRIRFERPALDEQFQRALETIVKIVQRQNAQLLAELSQDPDYAELPLRQQAKRYAELMGNSPIQSLMHLARKDQLDLKKARDVLQSPEQITAVLCNLGISDPAT
jgi:hypothetical protein